MEVVHLHCGNKIVVPVLENWLIFWRICSNVFDVDWDQRVDQSWLPLFLQRYLWGIHRTNMNWYKELEVELMEMCIKWVKLNFFNPSSLLLLVTGVLSDSTFARYVTSSWHRHAPVSCRNLTATLRLSLILLGWVGVDWESVYATSRSNILIYIKFIYYSLWSPIPIFAWAWLVN